MKTLGLGILTRNCEHEILDRALASAAPHVDNVYITVADKEKPSAEIMEIAKKYHAHVSHFEWIKDFSAARNFNMDHCEDDWYVWMDTDDTIEGLEKAKERISALADNISFVICTYNYAFYASGQVMTKHPKERFFRNSGEFEWKGRLHETCVSGIQLDGTSWDDITWNHHTNEERSLESALRNVNIVEEEVKEQGKTGKLDPRTVFNLGMAYASVAQRTAKPEDWKKAIRAFHQYLNVGGWDEHAYLAWKFIGYGQQCVERPDLALDSYFEALKIQPSYADAYAAIGSAYDRLNMLDKAEIWYKLALTDGRENVYAHDVGLATITPLVSLARIYALKGKIDDAEKYAKLSLQITGKDDQVEGMLNEIMSIKAKLARGNELVEQLKALPEAEAKSLWESLSENEKVIPSVIGYRRSMCWMREKKDKSITIFTGQSWEEWNPESAKTGIGGSEEAVINMAKQLKALGWNVTVYGSHGSEPKEYDGIWYRPWWDFSIEEPCDIFIGWRDPGVFEFKINAKKKYLWLHDTNEADSLTPKRLANITKVITLSKWHRNLYPNVPDQQMMVSRNGIIPEHFAEEVERKPHRVLYTSAPNRGLLCLLEMWPEIRKKVPDAELYWAYGWQTYDKAAQHNPQMQSYKKLVVDKLKQEGVHDLGRIGHEELAKVMLSGSVWAYPTEFTEISCITAMKMQAAGVVPICTTVAALDETVQHGIKFDVANIYTNEEAKTTYIDQVVKILTEGYAGREEMQTWAREFYGWNTVASEWSQEFSENI